MPVEFDRDAGGYRLGTAANGPQYGLPGLWFNAQEIVALLTMHRLLEDLDSGGLLLTLLDADGNVLLGPVLVTVRPTAGTPGSC